MVKKVLGRYLVTAVFILLFFLSGSLKLQSQWVKQDLPIEYESNMYLDIWFLEDDPDYGWVCGFNGKILITQNGGVDWEGVSIDSLGGGQLESIHFLNKDLGYVVGAGGPIFRSEDGGRHWTKINTGISGDPTYWGLHFYDDMVGVALGGGTCVRGVDGNADGFTVSKTTDGGYTWVNRQFSSSQIDTKFADPLILEADGEGYAVSSGYLWYSTDGLDWKIDDLTGGIDWHEEITYYNGSFCLPYSIGCQGADSDVGGGVRMKTSEHDWINFNTSNTMYGSFLLSENEGWVCGSSAALWHTTDGGRSWELKNCGIAPDESLDDIRFIDDSTGWVVGNGIFKYTPLDTVPPTIMPEGKFCSDEQVRLWLEERPDAVRWFINGNLVANGADTVSAAEGDTVRALVEYRKRPYCGWTEDYAVEFYPIPDPKIIGGDTLLLCKDDSLELATEKQYEEYYWSTGARTAGISVDKAGLYSVGVIDSNGCQSATSIEIVAAPEIDYSLITSKIPDICFEDSIDIELIGEYDSFIWHRVDSSGTDIPLDSVSNPLLVGNYGYYYAEVENKYGCNILTDTVFLKVRLDSNSFRYRFETSSREEAFEDTKYPDLICRYLTIENITNETQVLTDAYFKENIEFTVPPNELPMAIGAGSTADIKVCFTGYDYGIRRDTLVLIDNCFNHYIPMKVESSGNEYTGNSKCDIELDFTGKGIDRSYVAFFDFPYPNPTATQFAINAIGTAEDIQNAKIRIFDTEGRQVDCKIRIEPSGGESATVTINHMLPSGVYLLVIDTGRKQYTYNIKVNR